ncbi:MAG: DUF4402 domain-containing protein [Bacteroidetes bacterium]|nr:DUF4402 domain-containing protein [Bacteroidota bacterium]
MKTTIKISALFLMFTGFAASSFAQVSATASASATIVTPIAITKTVDMNFGNVAVSSSLGTVILAPAGTRTPTGGVTLPATNGTVAAASFSITGAPNYTYSISLPTSNIVVYNGPNNTMQVNAFTSTPTPTGTLDGFGNQTLNVGATLNVAGSQNAGTYVTTTPFTVTVNYN